MEFLILACDGIWDVMTNQKAVDFLHSKCYNNDFANENRNRSLEDLVDAVESLLDECCAKDENPKQGLGTDNMTAIVVEFRSGPARENSI